MSKPVSVSESEALLIFGPYAPKSNKIRHDHIMIRICGKGIDQAVHSYNDDLSFALTVIENELRRRLAERRQQRLNQGQPAPKATAGRGRKQRKQKKP